MGVGVYTVKEIAKVLKISEKTVYRLIRDQEISHIRVRGQIRITAMALDIYLKGGQNIDQTTEGQPIYQK